MTKKRNHSAKQRRHKTNRVARQKQGNRTDVFQHRNAKGYDVPMIRDFLEQLLLEVRVQHYENLQSLALLRKHGDVGAMCQAADKSISPALVEQLQQYLRKYETQLIYGDAVDGENASQVEINEVTEAFIHEMTVFRDEQIGHLDALQELFDESLTCAKLPFGISRDGHFCSPNRVLKVREWIDQQIHDEATSPM